MSTASSLSSSPDRHVSFPLIALKLSDLTAASTATWGHRLGPALPVTRGRCIKVQHSRIHTRGHGRAPLLFLAHSSPPLASFPSALLPPPLLRVAVAAAAAAAGEHRVRILGAMASGKVVSFVGADELGVSLAASFVRSGVIVRCFVAPGVRFLFLVFFFFAGG